ncbi:hypothetical protein [Tissierella sp. Yu-01]|jgi:hypothetical protein|uniref:hypothetical protein n=1 Tax=Tissierella sp. Yu-01 TaxID=3035694 RepID=UPI00240DD1B4|nr:hypothetical protein [Tissierella sp. Yu-01]WFA09577.1 hypothetical protein P3962_03215 [Tissierella sp. Yu-01]
MIIKLDHKPTDFTNSTTTEGFKKVDDFYNDDLIIEEEDLILMPEIDEWECVFNNYMFYQELNNRDDLL